jgi:type II secretion system protein E
MLLSDKLVLKLLSLTPEQTADLTKEQEKTGKSFQQLVLSKNLVSERELTKRYGDYIGVPFVTVEKKDIPDKALKLIPEPVARQYRAIIFKIDDNGLIHLALNDPDDIQAVNFLQKELGARLKIYVATNQNILDCLELYRGDVTEELTHVIDIQKEEHKSQEVREEDISEDSPIAQTVNLLLEYAIKSNASDIHIEPREDHVQVRYRIDGVLHEVNRLPKNVLGALVSRIKILSNLKIDERRAPQDGRFKIKLNQNTFAFRVSTLPISDGEKVVMRVLSESSEALTLRQLGMWGKSLEIINKAIHQPNGMMLVTGPTGSGKSTTLFSVLSILNTPDVNISTIEDPVEYKIPGVNQTQTNPKAGMTFASGLRALLRQDPNVIMVGEIRDGETANLGVQAALTGHMVFSTLHTNNAATCLPRLLDMKIEPFLIASTVNAVIGQRLVRRLCKHCRERVAMPSELQQQIFDLLHTNQEFDNAKMHRLEKRAKEDGVGEDVELSTTETNIDYYWKPHEGGCEHCNHTGYKGRVGIYEVLDNTVEIQKMIIAAATANEIQDQAIKEDMIIMRTDGIIKALRGMTSFEEVFGATKD